MRISNSFSEGEIQVMEFIVQTLLRGGTPTMATRHKEFASLCRKIMAMKSKVLEQKQRPAPEDAAAAEAKRPVLQESSVGTVGAPPMETESADEVREDIAKAV